MSRTLLITSIDFSAILKNMDKQTSSVGSLGIKDLLIAVVAVSAFFALQLSGWSFDNSMAYLGNRTGIVAGQSIGPLEILTPNGGEKWTFGSQHSIRWRGGNSASKVDVYLIDGNGQQLFRTLLSKTDNDGTEEWIVDVPVGEYKLQMISCAGCVDGSGFDSSDGVFTVVADPQAVVPSPRFPANASLAVFSPSGGEIYQPGETVNLYWYGGYPDWQLTLTLMPVSESNTIKRHTIDESVANDGIYTWSIPSSAAFITEGDYFMRIECTNCDNGTNGTSAYSFRYLTIKSY